MLKRIFVIFLIIMGGYIGMEYLLNGDVFSKGKNSARVDSSTDKISIDIASMETKIIPEDRKDVFAELDGKGKVTVDRKGDEIRVTARQNGFFNFNWKDFQPSSITIYIPEDYDKDIDLELGSGKLEFFGPSAQNPMELEELEIEVGSGRMELENLQVKNLVHNSSSGDVEMNSVTASTGTIKVGSGRMKVKGYTGQLDAELSSGELEIGMEKLTDALSLNVSSGNMELDLPDSADFTLDGKISSGDLTCDFPLKNKKETEDRISGKHGNGKHDIDADVSSGKLEIH